MKNRRDIIIELLGGFVMKAVSLLLLLVLIVGRIFESVIHLANDSIARLLKSDL